MLFQTLIRLFLCPEVGAAPAAAAVKKPRKVSKSKAKAKPSSNGKAESSKRPDGLRKPQVRVLIAMKGGKAMTRDQVAEKAEVDQAFCSQYLGRLDPKKRAAADKTYGFKSLITLGMVKAEKHDVKGKDTVVFTITAAGVKAAAK